MYPCLYCPSQKNVINTYENWEYKSLLWQPWDWGAIRYYIKLYNLFNVVQSYYYLMNNLLDSFTPITTTFKIGKYKTPLIITKEN